MKRYAFAISIAFIIHAADAESVAPRSTQQTDDRLTVTVSDIRRNWLLVPTGLDVTLSLEGRGLLGYGKAGLSLTEGGGYERLADPRDLQSGEPLRVENGKFDHGYDSPNFQWDLIARQQLVPGSPLAAFSGYRGRLDIAMTEGSTAVFKDRNLIQGNSFIAGVAWDGVAKTSREIPRGLEAELSGEFALGAMNPTGGADYSRVTGKLAGFLPLDDLKADSGTTLLTPVLAGRLMADYADGPSVPLFVTGSLGGRKLEGSGGYEVRGYGRGRLDTKLKAVANAELRLLGPSLLDIDSLVPFLTAHVDAGFFRGYWGAKTAVDESAFALSLGASCGLVFFGIFEPSLGLSFPLVGEAPSSPQVIFLLSFHW